eukprot:11702517-Alexandrium_andersonii.AAC.1
MEDSGTTLVCAGCKIKSNDHCPVAKKKGSLERVRWARNRTKKVSGAAGTKTKKVPSGAWCRTCYNLWRSHFKKEVPDLGQVEAILADPKEKAFKRKWAGRLA